MTDLQVIFYTACTTLLGGVILLVLTELLKVIVISPVQRTRERAQIAVSKVDFYSHKLTNFFPKNPNEVDIELIRTISRELREAATELDSQYAQVPLKNVFSWLKILPSEASMTVAYSSLIYLHNSILFEGKREYIVNQIEMNNNRIDRIKAALTGADVPAELKSDVRQRM